MKRILTAAVLFLALIGNAQETTLNIGNIKIRSKIALTYDSRQQKSDTIYISIQRWNYDGFNYNAEVVDCVKNNATYTVINKKFKSYTKAEIDGLFTALQNSILPSESYSEEMDSLLTMGLLLDTRTNLLEGDKTVYGGVGSNWEIAN